MGLTVLFWHGLMHSVGRVGIKAKLGESLEMQNMCAEVRLYAERRAGELLKEQDLKTGNPQYDSEASTEALV